MKRDILKDFILDNPEPEPTADIAKCSSCGWSGHVSECEMDSEGDWESGYYDIHLCPKCDDGGCIDDYDYSDEQAKRFNEYHDKRNKTIRQQSGH